MSSTICVETNLLQIETGEWGLQGKAKKKMRGGTVLTRNVAVCHILYDTDQRCESCLGSYEKLYRCSSCHVIQYCGRNCQKRDFRQHRLECKVISDEPLYKDSTLEVKHEIRLLLRFLAVSNFLQRKDKNLCCWSSGNNGVNAVVCGVDHLNTMAKVPTSTFQMSTLVKEIVMKWVSSVSSFRLNEILRTFQANNFGILDVLHNTIGQGVYPHAAILNHSCDPNCILRFTNSDIEIVALRDIAKGEQLTHSYIDLVKDTITRQQHLSTLHGFVCSCKRCRGEIKINLPLRPSDDLYQWVLSDRNPLIEKSRKKKLYSTKEDIVLLDIDQAMFDYGGRQLTSSMVKEGRELLYKAKVYMMENKTEAEKQSLRTAIKIFENGPHFSLDLYEARCLYLSALLLSGEECAARHQCLAIVAFLLVVLPPNHPLIGLQLYTLADLTADVSTYWWSRNLLRISHGDKHDLVRTLDEQMNIS
mmetsp:Transcript_17029/g.25775  ORF Transcript_17029/g.25775 Transcript_17029/m.25775 type:complete len:474 (+) Transcript_17029:50-1471(+)